MEMRAMECVRQVLVRCAEALFVLQLYYWHYFARLLQSFVLLQLNFHQSYFCSEEGDRLATRLVSVLMEYYTGPPGGGTVDDIRCQRCLEKFHLADYKEYPEYSVYLAGYKESDYKVYLAAECLDKAATAFFHEDREPLARDAFSILSGVLESVNLQTVCKRFEDLRFYEAVVRLPLQKAQALEPAGDAPDAGVLEHALAQRERCYDIIISALRSLKEEVSPREFCSPMRSYSFLSPADKKKHICQIIQLGVQSSDKIFHEYLYWSLIDLGLEDELLEFGGPDLVPFLQNAGCKATQEHQARVSPLRHSGAPTKCFELLARYYVQKGQRVLAAHVLLGLAEWRSSGLDNIPTLDQRRQYLSNAVIQAKSKIDNGGLRDLLEGKLTVLQFQIKLKQELEGVVSKVEATPKATSNDSMAEYLQTIKEKVKELSLDLKTITQLHNDYAVPFERWEICLELLYFASYSGDTDSSIVRDTWVRLMDQALSKGGIAEACSVLKRIGSHVYPGDSLDTLCLHLEKAAMDRLASGVEFVGDEDVARALLAACKGALEPVLNTYDHLLSNGAILLSPRLKLRLLRSVLVVLREWGVSARGMGRRPMGASPIPRGAFSIDQRTSINHEIRGAADRYITEVRSLPLPQHRTEVVYRGFKELQETIFFPFKRF